MKAVALSKGYFSVVDDEDFERVNMFCWWVRISKDNKRMYGEGLSIRDGLKRKFFLYRYVMGAKKGEQVHHKNGNGLDNRRCNLEICTPMNNARATFNKDSNTSSKFKGVSFRFDAKSLFSRKWRARICVNYRTIRIGSFRTQEEAAKAYDEAAIKYYRDYAVTNKMLGLL